MSEYQLTKNTGSKPDLAVVTGKQHDSGYMYAGVALTDHGDIPGKVQGNSCWYCYGGEESETDQFKWLVAPHYAIELVKNNGSPPHNAIGVGCQSDSGTYYLAVAITPSDGTIPGKAQGNNCWYPMAGNEHSTENFYWVTERNV